MSRLRPASMLVLGLLATPIWAAESTDSSNSASDIEIISVAPRKADVAPALMAVKPASSQESSAQRVAPAAGNTIIIDHGAQGQARG